MLPTPTRDPDAVKGVMYGLTAYTMWGCFPLFFALFDGIPAFEILIHRIIWACLFLVGLITLLRLTGVSIFMQWSRSRYCRRAWATS